MLIKKLFYFVESIPKKVSVRIYSIINHLRFHIYADVGGGIHAYNKIYLSINPKAKLVIGEEFTLTSGSNFNPLCRNKYACIVAEREDAIIKIGSHVGMSSPCLWAKNKIIIGDYVNIGGDCIIMDSDAHSLDWHFRDSGIILDNGLSEDASHTKTSPIIIEDHVLVGTRCIILKGVRIGFGSVIAAGSIVTKDIPPNCIAGGNPCKVIKYL